VVIQVHFGDNLTVLKTVPNGVARLVYIDPPFNTGKRQTRKRTRKVRDPQGDHRGFKGQRYRTEVLGEMSFADVFAEDRFLPFLEPRLREAKRLLTRDGSFFLHLDFREVHYAKVLCDQIFGRDCFMNEIVWAYDFGGRPKDRWPSKHDNILWYALNPNDYVYKLEDVDRIPYLAPGLVTAEKAERGKVPTDVWWQTIVPTSGNERTGYPTQKPLKLLERIVRAHSHPDDLVVDFFAGSGTTGEAAAMHGRRALLIDDNPEAMRVMERRLAGYDAKFVGWPT